MKKRSKCNLWIFLLVTHLSSASAMSQRSHSFPKLHSPTGELVLKCIQIKDPGFHPHIGSWPSPCKCIQSNFKTPLLNTTVSSQNLWQVLTHELLVKTKEIKSHSSSVPRHRLNIVIPKERNDSITRRRLG